MTDSGIAQQVDPRAVVRGLVTDVTPHDALEADHRAWMLDWIDSGAQLFRVEKPATPPKHLAVYAVLLDEASRSVMLVAHILAQKWLMPGGHVDEGEDPRETVLRELQEELQIAPQFHRAFGDAPAFLTVTWTVPPFSHHDATLWFVFDADRSVPVIPDPREFSEVRWWSLDAPEGYSGGDFDPGFSRFLDKLSAHLSSHYAQ